MQSIKCLVYNKMVTQNCKNITGLDKRLLYTAVFTKQNSSLLFIAFRGSLSKHPVTLVQCLDWVPVIPVCECRVLAVSVFM